MSMSHVAAAFGIVFKVFSIILEVLVIFTLSFGGWAFILLTFFCVAVLYDLVFLVFIVKGFRIWRKDNESQPRSI